MPKQVDTWLTGASIALHEAGVESARLDCLILLEDALGIDRASLLAHPEREIDHVTEVALNTKVAQRLTHTPLAYIRGKSFFYGREFSVTSDVLVPRPESEAIITFLKPLPGIQTIADIGTGSGCLGIIAALAMPHAKVTLYDISKAALKVARANAKQHHAVVKLVHSDLLAARPVADVLLANLPYVPTNYPINQAATHEPPLALFAGQDGLDLYRRFWHEVPSLPTRPRHIITEALQTQHAELADLAKAAGYRIAATDGPVQHFVPVTTL